MNADELRCENCHYNVATMVVEGYDVCAGCGDELEQMGDGY